MKTGRRESEPSPPGPKKPASKRLMTLLMNRSWSAGTNSFWPRRASSVRALASRIERAGAANWPRASSTCPSARRACACTSGARTDQPRAVRAPPGLLPATGRGASSQHGQGQRIGRLHLECLAIVGFGLSQLTTLLMVIAQVSVDRGQARLDPLRLPILRVCLTQPAVFLKRPSQRNVQAGFFLRCDRDRSLVAVDRLAEVHPATCTSPRIPENRGRSRRARWPV